MKSAASSRSGITEQKDEATGGATAAIAIGHAGEILQGAVENAGRLHRVLVSLPATELQAKAILRRSALPGLHIVPSWKQKSLRAAELAFQALGDPCPGGLIEVQSNIPIGCGLGSSTSDCVATIRAVAKSCGQLLSAEDIGQIAQQAEGSSDGTMFDDRLVAFLHCEGRVHQYFTKPLPAFRMLVVEPAQKTSCVDTDSLPRPDYSPAQVDRFHRLLVQLEAAMKIGDAQAIGAVACASAAINQLYFPKPHYDVVMHVAERTEALGVAAAHSGTVLALLYNDNTAVDVCVVEARQLLAERQLTPHLDLRSPEYSSE